MDLEKSLKNLAKRLEEDVEKIKEEYRKCIEVERKRKFHCLSQCSLEPS